MRKIVIDGKTRHGKPILEGTRVTVEEVLGMLASGMTYDEIKEEYGLTKEDVMIVMKYMISLMHGEEVHKVR